MTKQNKKWSENDELFFSELDKGHAFQSIVADIFRQKGFLVEQPKKRVRKHISEAAKFAENEIDLLVGSENKKILFEVKSRNLYFTKPENYPFDTAFVDTVSSWDQKRKKPAATILISQKTKSIVVVPSSSFSQWKEEKKRDRVRDIEDTWWTVPVKCLKTLDDLCKWLKTRL